MAYEIRAMSLGEIVDTSFRVLRNHFVPLVAISALVNVPFALGQSLIQEASQAADSPALPLFGVSVTFVSLAILSPIVTAAVTGLIGDVYLGRSAQVGAAFRVAFRILLPLLGTSILAGILYVLGMLALIIPGIWFGLGIIALTPIMVIEGSFGMTAIRRSLDLLKGNRGRAFLLYLLVGIVGSILGGTFGLVAGTAPLVGGLLNGLASSLTAAFLSVLSVVFYFEIRCRKEGFEVEHLARLVREGAGPELAPGT